MNSTPNRETKSWRLPVKWVDSPVVGPLVISLRKVRAIPVVGTPRCGVRPSRYRPPAVFSRGLSAFTLLELMVVIGIIGFIAAMTLPHVGGMGQANSMTTATRQMLDDVAFARKRAMVNRSTVYMVFLPPMFWTNYGYFNSANVEAENVLTGRQMTNLMAHQYSAYALVSLTTVGDQPGQHTPHYITDWRSLPNGVFIAPFEFTMTNTFTNLYTTNTLSGNTNVSSIWPWTRVSIPFPSLYPPNMNINLPCIGFTPQGSLTTQFTNQYIALARGSIFYPTDTNGIPLLEPPMWSENPPGNDANNPNLIQIDWLTARATLLQNQFQ